MADYIKREDLMRSIISDDSDLTAERIFQHIKDCHSPWISVKDRMPKEEKEVLICAESKHWRTGETIQIVSLAFHTSGNMTTGDSSYNWDDDIDRVYDEERDEFLVPEGWWEAVSYSEYFSAVDRKVTHWMPLPEPPKEVNDG